MNTMKYSIVGISCCPSWEFDHCAFGAACSRNSFSHKEFPNLIIEEDQDAE